MRKLLCMVVLALFACAMAYAQETAEATETEKVAGLPTSLEQFQQQIAEKAKDPKAAVKLFFDALFVYVTKDKELGKLLLLEMSKDKEWDSKSWQLYRRQVDEKPYIAFSYAKEATPENKYTFDPNKYELVFTSEPNLKPFDDKAEGEYCKLFIKCNGADNPRPITLIANKRGEWKFYEFSSVFLGVKPPYEPLVWANDVPESADPVWVVHEWLKGILQYLGGDAAGAELTSSLMEEADLTFSTFHDTVNADKSYIWRSYVKGTSPANKYEVADVNSFEIDTYYQPNEEPTEDSTSVRMFIRSSGADSARPIKLKKDTRGQWRVNEYSSLCVGIRKPASEADGEF